MRGAGVIPVLRNAYRVDRPEESWLQELATATEDALGTSLGEEACALTSIRVPVPEDPFGVRTRVESPDRVAFLEALDRFEALVSSLPCAQHVRNAHRQTLCLKLREWAPEAGLDPDGFQFLFNMFWMEQGIADLFCIQGADLGGMALTLQLPLRSEFQLHPRVRSTWSRIATHLAAAIRLRRSLQGAPIIETGQAVFDERARCVHADPDIADTPIRERLRQAAIAVDQATRFSGDDSEEGLDLWQGLFEGSFTMVDAFDSDGRRYFVAHRNSPQVAEDRALTRREQQVVALAAVGNQMHVVAYSLGLSESTAQTHLRRALAKMGIESRQALIELSSSLRN